MRGEKIQIPDSQRIHDIWSKTISSKRRLVECDIWSIRHYADYDVWSTTTIGRKFVELRRNVVQFWSKTDLYRKNENWLHLRFSHLRYIFKPVSVFMSPPFRVGRHIVFPRASVCLSVCLSQTCPLYNLKTTYAIFTKLYTNINEHEMTCRVQEW